MKIYDFYLKPKANSVKRINTCFIFTAQCRTRKQQRQFLSLKMIYEFYKFQFRSRFIFHRRWECWMVNTNECFMSLLLWQRENQSNGKQLRWFEWKWNKSAFVVLSNWTVSEKRLKNPEEHTFLLWGVDLIVTMDTIFDADEILSKFIWKCVMLTFWNLLSLRSDSFGKNDKILVGSHP